MAGGSGFNVNVPDPAAVQLEGNKTDVYERQQVRREKDRRMQSLSDLAGRLLEGKGQTDSVSGPDGSIRQSADTYERITEQLESFYETPQGTADGTLKEKVDELSLRLEEAEAENRRAESRERMMEQSYRMAARYLTPNPEGSPGEAKEEEKPEPVPVSRAESGTTSALEQPLTDSAFVASLAVERNYGFNTAVGSGYALGKNTIAACIHQDQTVMDGQQVKLRLLEPLQAGNLIIPRNTVVSGTGKVQGERLDITVSSVQYQGNILPVELAVYDNEGMKGLCIETSLEREAAKEAMANIGGGLGTSISFARSAGQQVAMDITRGLMQGGSQYLAKKFRTVKVHLKAGDPLMLYAKQQ